MKIKTRTYIKDLDKAYQAGYEAGYEDAMAASDDNDRYRRLNDEVFHMRDEVFSMKNAAMPKVHKEKKHKKPRILGVVKVGPVCHDHEAKPAEAPTGSEAPAQAAQE